MLLRLPESLAMNLTNQKSKMKLSLTKMLPLFHSLPDMVARLLLQLRRLLRLPERLAMNLTNQKSLMKLSLTKMLLLLHSLPDMVAMLVTHS